MKHGKIKNESELIDELTCDEVWVLGPKLSKNKKLADKVEDEIDERECGCVIKSN